MGNIDPTYRFAMDYDLFVRYMSVDTFKRVNRFLAAFRVHQKSKTSSEITTIGSSEMDRVLSKYNIKRNAFIGHPFHLWVSLRSSIYIRLHQSYPGLPPGKGFNLSDVWGDT